jgi:hypothetical protein
MLAGAPFTDTGYDSNKILYGRIMSITVAMPRDFSPELTDIISKLLAKHHTCCQLIMTYSGTAKKKAWTIPTGHSITEI